jgi:hypothetical protein
MDLIVYVLVDDSYTSLRSAIHFVWFGLWGSKGSFGLLPLLQGAEVHVLGSPGSAGSGNGSNVQDHKRLKHHTLTQNLNAMGLWVPSLIYILCFLHS